MTLTVLDTPSVGAPAVRVIGVPGPHLFVPAPRESGERLAMPAVGPRHARPGPVRPRSVRPRYGRASRAPRSHGWVDHLLTVAALLGLATVGVTVFAAQSGLRPLVVRSGSMEPTIATGAMVLVRTVPASQIRVGDVVAVERPDHTRVTHRVVSVEHRGATASLVLKGDANQDPDPVPVVVTDAGRFVWTAPLLGRVGAFLSSARGGFALGWLVSAVMLAVLRRTPEPCDD